MENCCDKQCGEMYKYNESDSADSSYAKCIYACSCAPSCGPRSGYSSDDPQSDKEFKLAYQFTEECVVEQEKKKVPADTAGACGRLSASSRWFRTHATSHHKRRTFQSVDHSTGGKASGFMGCVTR